MADQDQNPYRNQSRKVFDIVNPGKIQPDPTSKPVLPSNKPRVEDNSVGLRKPNPTLDDYPPAEPAKPPLEQSAESTSAVKQPQPPKPHRRWRIMLLLIIGIVLLFVIADLLVDDQIIHTSITPLTHFFHHS